MKHTHEEKIAYLFDEIGGVDDQMLAEAMEYRSTKRQGQWLRTLTAIACALLVTVTGATVVLTNWKGWFIGEGAGNSAPGDVSSQWNTHTLEALLQDARGDAEYTLLSSVREVPYFGDAHLLWQYADDDVIYQSRALSARELERIYALISHGEAVGAHTPTQPVRVWLVNGNGDVLTPYLPTTPGNISTTLFDYEAELIPSDELISCISDILKP